MSTLRSAGALAKFGFVPRALVESLEPVAARYAVAVTPAMVRLIERGEPADPIAHQFLPDPQELLTTPEEHADPIGDEAHSPVPGIVHRYPDRVLLTPTLACAVYCRFCFRREVVGPGTSAVLPKARLATALDYIRTHEAIWEVILTGGDPLVLSPRRIGEIMAALAGMPHVKVVRIHTRVPAVAPEKITPALVAALKRSGKAVYVALHANHPRELTPEARAACARLIDAGIPMLSQTVLLRGVNDDAEVLAALMRAFVETRIRPYYLHQLDRAPGTSHFRVPIDKGQALMRALRGRVSGLCQPTYIFDIPGGAGKVPIGPGYLSERTVEDPNGGVWPLV
jgi:lysine 2,3-aminomutase